VPVNRGNKCVDADYITKTASIGHFVTALQVNLLKTRFNGFYLRRYNENQHAGTGRSKDVGSFFSRLFVWHEELSFSFFNDEWTSGRFLAIKASLNYGGMGFGRIFSRKGGNCGFVQGGGKGGEILFYPIETKKTTFFCWKVNRKTTSKFRRPCMQAVAARFRTHHLRVAFQDRATLRITMVCDGKQNSHQGRAAQNYSLTRNCVEKSRNWFWTFGLPVKSIWR